MRFSIRITTPKQRSGGFRELPREMKRFLVVLYASSLLIATAAVRDNLLHHRVSILSVPSLSRAAVVIALFVAVAAANQLHLRWRRVEGRVASLSSTWTLPLALLPPVWIVALSTFGWAGTDSGGREWFKKAYNSSLIMAITLLAHLTLTTLTHSSSPTSLTPRYVLALAAAFAVAIIYSIIPSLVLAHYLQRNTSPWMRLKERIVNNISYAELGGFVGAILSVLWPPLALLVMGVLIPMKQEQMFLQVQEQASEDQKTGLINSECWREHVMTQLEHAQSSEGELAILMCDLDHFKAINDTHGHLAGDEVLTQAVKLLRECIRRADVLGRFGGDEFVLCLPDTPTQVAVSIAEDIRRRVGSTEMVLGNGVGVGVTASVGVAVLAKGGRLTLDQLLSHADTALYAAKDAGRDVVALVDGSGVTLVGAAVK